MIGTKLLLFVALCGVLLTVQAEYDPNLDWGFLDLESLADVKNVGNAYHTAVADFDQDGYDDIMW